jgi:hypothetical protein
MTVLEGTQSCCRRASAPRLKAAWTMLALTTTLAARPALAQSTADKAAAEALFDQGRGLMLQRDFANACGLLERSQHIDPGVGTLLYLAECYEKSGRTASAWATFREAADAADAARQTARARTARDRATRLEPQLSRLTISVDPETADRPGLVIERRGVPVPPATFNVPVPVDPGPCPITAQAPGYEPWSDNVTVPERAGTATATVPALKAAAGGAPFATAKGRSAGERDPGQPSAADGSLPSSVGTSESSSLSPSILHAEANPGKSQRTLAYIVGGAGVVGVGIGSYFGLRAISKSKSVDDLAGASCAPNRVCTDPSVAEEQDHARSAARVSNIAFVLGGAALIGGVVLYLTSPKAAPQTAHVAARLTAGGMLLEGTFQ